MKKEFIRKLSNKSIKKWKDRLGFSGWKIDAKITVFNRADDFPQQGDFRVNYPKKKATILIGTILKSSVEEIIVHELIHLMLWLLDQKVVSMIRNLPHSKQNKAKDDFLGELEKVVEHITKAFLQTKK